MEWVQEEIYALKLNFQSYVDSTQTPIEKGLSTQIRIIALNRGSKIRLTY